MTLTTVSLKGGGIIGGFKATNTEIQVIEVKTIDSIETESKREKTNKKEKVARVKVGSKTYNIFPEIKEEIFAFFVQRGFASVERWVELTGEFMQHRCELKKAYNSFKKLENSRFFPNLIELSQGDIEQAQALVRNAIAEGWHTVYAIKSPNNSYKTKKEQDQERYREGFKRFMGDIDIKGVMEGRIDTEADWLYGDKARDFLFKDRR